MKTGQNGYGSKPWYEYPSVHTIAGGLASLPGSSFLELFALLVWRPVPAELAATSSKVQSYDGTSTTMEKWSDQNRIS